MKVYAVGGAVRDELLGLPVQDRDYVVVGATPEDMVKLGYQSVGKDFPVFLHPQTHEQYALARTERKTAPGYKGFQIHASPTVTLEEDLGRRDLTINAIARTPDGVIVDPYGGVADLKEKRLRHVSAAFVEDPVRVLRVARFFARFTDFSLANETRDLMRKMVEAGEVDALVPERVWQELATGLMEAKPSRMFCLLRDCGALKKILPEVDRLFGVPQPAADHPEVNTGAHVMLALDYAAQQAHSLRVRFAVLSLDLGKSATPPELRPKHAGHEERSADMARAMARRLRVPGDCGDLAVLAARYHAKIHQALTLNPSTIITLLMQVDAFRRPERFEDLLAACACDFHGRVPWQEQSYPQADYLRGALTAARSVDAGKIAAQIQSPQGVAAALRQLRVERVRAFAKTSQAHTSDRRA
jgi:tRNA nucleotidyltransferase (CCA-adding enzyme)